MPEEIQVVSDFQYDPAHPPDRVGKQVFTCPNCGPFDATVPWGTEAYACPKCGVVSPRRALRFIGKLVLNVFAKPLQRYIEEGGSPNIIQWRQQFEAANVVRSDGTPAIYSNTVNVTDKNGDKLGEGGAAHTLGLYYEGLGICASPSDPRSGQYIDHYFELEGTEIKLGKRGRFTKFIFKPIAYFGTQCPPITEKRVLEARDGDSSPGMPAAAPAQAVNEEVVAQQLADLCDGHKATEVFNLALGSMGTVTQLFGMPFFGGLAAPRCALIAEMVNRGYLAAEADGTLRKIAGVLPAASDTGTIDTTLPFE